MGLQRQKDVKASAIVNAIKQQRTNSQLAQNRYQNSKENRFLEKQGGPFRRPGTTLGRDRRLPSQEIMTGMEYEDNYKSDGIPFGGFKQQTVHTAIGNKRIW